MARYIVLILVLGGISFPLNAQVSNSYPSSADAAITLLYSAGVKAKVDQDGYTYRVFTVSEDSGLQTLVDSITSRLLATAIGTSICRDLLNGDPALLAKHLGISRDAAQGAAQECTKPASAKVGSASVYDANQDPARITGVTADAQRRYVIVVTNNPKVTIDSWTEAYSNITTLFLHHSPERSDLNLRYLTQAIAHEMAIYFDAKAWPWGPDWHRIKDLAEVRVVGADETSVQMAALNPAINTVLSFIRAYKVERQMLRELVAQGKLGPDPIFYSPAEFPFLRLSCGNDCLKTFILEQRDWLASLYRPLLAYTPHYRVRRLEMERTTALARLEAVDELLIKVLETFPAKFVQSTTMRGMFFDHLLRNHTETDEKEDLLTAKVMTETLLPTDLNVLARSRIEVWAVKSPIDTLSFLSIPLLSDANSGISSGPRPRIRTGGTQ